MNHQHLVDIDGESLRRLRLAACLRQTDVASLAEVDTSYLSMLETGKRRRASLQVAQRLAEALTVNVSTISVKKPQD